ncbi:hypothetical protein, partial [Pseudoalteromonas sp. BMB]|uniref:hypothetical protein n=1 Tax=Pseudoalteromonas sp. BMB TaxID=1874619 RepID=UPI001112D1EC
MATLMFHFQSNGIPDNDEKVTEWCEVGDEVRECGGNYTTKCLTPLQREFLQLFVGGGASAEKEFCTPGSELRTKYLKHGGCLAEAAESDVFKGIVKDAQVALETTFDAE